MFCHMHLVYNSNVSSVWSIGGTTKTDQWEQSSWVAMGSEGDKIGIGGVYQFGNKKRFYFMGY